jgi:hypothetical protein
MAKQVASKPATMEDILERQITDFEPPRPIPPGDYTFVIEGQPRQDKSSQRQTLFYEYRCRPLAAMESVDAQALAEAGGLENKSLRLTFYITNDSGYRLTDFLQNTLGLDVTGMKVSQAVGEAVGCQFIGHVTHQTSRDGTRVFANIDDYAPVQ